MSHEHFILLFLLPWLALANNISLSTSCANCTINTPTTYTFTFRRKFNPINISIVQTVTVLPTDAYIEITFPASFTALPNKNYSCTSSTLASLNCSITNNLLTVRGYYNASNVASEENVVLVNDVTNPGRTGSSGEFQYAIKNSAGTALDYSPNVTNLQILSRVMIVPAAFSSVQIVAGGATSTISSLSVSVVPSNPIPASGGIVVVFPSSWANDITGGTIFNTTVSCSPITAVMATITCSIKDSVTILVTSLSTSSLNTPLSFSISGILLPPTVSPTDIITVRSQTSNSESIDSKQTSITGVISQTIPSISTSSLPTTVGVSANTTVSFQLANAMSKNDVILLTFPGEVGLPKAVSAVSPFFQFNSVINSTNNSVVLSNFLYYIDVVSSNVQITINIVNMTNPYTTASYSISVAIFRNGLLVQQGTTSNKATTNTLSFTLSPTQNTTSVDTSTLMTITTNTQIPIGGYITLQYPSSITPTPIISPSISQCKLGNNAISGCSYSLSSTLLTFTSIFTSIFQPSTILITFSQLTTPRTIQPVTFTLTTYSPGGNPIDTGTYTVAVNPTPLTSISLSSSNYTVLSTSNINVSFTTTIPFNMVSILIPSEISTLPTVTQTCTGTAMQSCQYSSSNISFLTSSSTSGQINLGWGNSIMPASFGPTGTFVLTTYYNGWVVSNTTAHVGLTMNIANTFTNTGYQLSSKINSGVSTLTINFTVPNMAPSGYLSISIPAQATISASPICSLNSVPVQCSKTLSSISLAYPNTSLSNTIIIQNITNPRTSAPTTNSIQLSLLDNLNFSSLLTPVGTIRNVNPSVLNFQVSTLTGFFAESTLITFNGILVTGQTLITVTLPQSFPNMAASPCQSCTLINNYQFSYPVLSSATSFSFTANLTTPSTNTSSNTFTLTTYVSTYIVEQGTSSWTPKCYGTTCKDCQGTTCVSCYLKEVSPYFLLLNGNCTSECPDGNYIVNSVCTPCSTNCKSCMDSATKCTSCKANTYLNRLTNSCAGTCPDFYFPDSASLECAACRAPCEKCTNSSSCLSCSSGFFLSMNQCLPSCPTGLSIENITTRVCDPCSTNCLTCINFVFSCNSCNTSIPLYLQTSTCVSTCNTGYLPKDGVCSPCDPPCKTCINSTTRCLTCDQLSQTPLFLDYSCISTSSCSSTLGYYTNLANSSCNICPQNCSSCVSANNCTSCISGFYHYQGACVRSCPSDTYTDLQSCVKCTNNCSTCSSTTTCLTCLPSTYFYQSTCVGQCPTTTYTNNLNCTNCVGCLSCLNLTYCLSCVSGEYLYKNKCYDECPTGSFLNNTSCSSCPATCFNCSNSSYCYSCSPGYLLQNNSCVQTCSRGIASNGRCYPCGLNCADCGASSCNVCEQSHYLYQGYCQSSCPSTTIPVLGSCSPCANHYTDCKTCNLTACLSCSSGALVLGVCTTCPNGLFITNNQCADCPPTCSVCQNTSFCSACVSPNYLFNNTCQSQCPVNTIPSGGYCVQCSPHCSRCNQLTTQCDVCSPGFLVYQGGCTGNCPQGYIISVNQSNCVTQKEYYQEYSSSSKPIYFPFTIAGVILFLIVCGCKWKHPDSHLFTIAVSLLSVIELGSWLLLLVVEILVLSHGHHPGGYGVICMLIALVLGVAINLLHLGIYHRYFKKDPFFLKWISKQNHYCSTVSMLSLSSFISFKLFRFSYSKFLSKSNFSLQLTNSSSLKPVNILSILSLFLSTIPTLAGCGLAMYYSISKDQEFWVGLDALLVTGAVGVMMLLDVHHPGNYFGGEYNKERVKYVVEDEISDMKVRLEENGIEEYQFEGKEINSHLELLNDQKHLPPSKTNIMNRMENRTGEDQEGDEEEDEEQYYNAKQLWRKKNSIDERGYRILTGQDGVTRYYNDQGFQVKIINGRQVLFDEKGYRVQFNKQTGEYQRYNLDGYRVRINKQTGEQEYYDSKGYLVRYLDGGIKRYHPLGFQVRVNSETGEDELVNQDGYLVKVGDNEEISLYDSEGYEVFKNKIGMYERLNPSGRMDTEDPLENLDNQDNLENLDDLQNLNETIPGHEENWDVGDEGVGTKVIEEEMEDEEVVEIFVPGDQISESIKEESEEEQEVKEESIEIQEEKQLQDFVENIHKVEQPGETEDIFIFQNPGQQEQASFDQPVSVQNANMSQMTEQNQGIQAQLGEFPQQLENDILQSQDQESIHNNQPFQKQHHERLRYFNNLSEIDQRASIDHMKSPTLEQLADQVMCQSKHKIFENEGELEEQDEVEEGEKVETIGDDDEINSHSNTAEWEKNQEDSICPVQNIMYHQPEYFTIQQKQDAPSNDPENFNQEFRGDTSPNTMTIGQFNLDNSSASTVKKSPKKLNESRDIIYEEDMLFFDEFSRKKRGMSGLPNPMIQYSQKMDNEEERERERKKAERLQKMYFHGKRTLNSKEQRRHRN